jgi:hypothetical protein
MGRNEKTDYAEEITEALRVIEEHGLVFQEQILCFVPWSREVLYNHVLNDKNDTIKRALEQNRVRRKLEIQKKWYNSDNPTLQVAFYKLMASEEELVRLGRESVANLKPKVKIVRG